MNRGFYTILTNSTGYLLDVDFFVGRIRDQSHHIRYRMGSKDSRYPPFNDLDDGWHTSNLPPSRNSLYDIQIYSKTDLQIQEMET